LYLTRSSCTFSS